MSIHEQCCANCIHFLPIENELFDGQCTFITPIYTLVADKDYCIYHELDPNKKPQKTGKL